MRIPGPLASSGQFPRGLPGWSGSVGLRVWQCGVAGAVATLGMLESQAGWGDKIQPHPWVPRPAPPRPSRTRGGCPPVGQEGLWAQTQRRPRPRSLPGDLDAGVLRVRRLGLGGRRFGGPVEVDHVQVGVGEVVLRRGRPDGLDAGVLRVVVGLGGPGGRLLPLGQVQVCVRDVIVVLGLKGTERRSLRAPRLPPTQQHPQVWMLPFPPLTQP